jgi:hypothetical protein
MNALGDVQPAARPALGERKRSDWLIAHRALACFPLSLWDRGGRRDSGVEPGQDLLYSN